MAVAAIVCLIIFLYWRESIPEPSVEPDDPAKLN